MKRRALALFLAVCLLAGFVALPSGAAAPTLVCRVTGQPMAPVLVAEEAAAGAPDAARSCCAVAAKRRADGSTRYALTTPGCCDLRVAPERAEPPAAAVVAAPDIPFLAWTPALLVLFVPPATKVVTLPMARYEAAPRAPPPSSASPRAPPDLS